MKQQTGFKTLAMMIDAKIGSFWYCCNHLTTEKASWLEEYFRPTAEERMKYDMFNRGWLGSRWESLIKDNKFRVLVLLFADKIYRSEMADKRRRKQP